MRLILRLVVVIFVLVATIWSISRLTSYQIFGELVSRVDTDQKIVALTFDDGPTVSNTEKILAVLKQHNVKATFFLVGQDIAANPLQAKQIAADGHEIGNHSYSHSRMVFKSQEFIAREIDQTNKLIKKAGYQGPVYFRPPYGKKFLSLPYYLNKTKLKTITWDVAPENDLAPGASSIEIASTILNAVKPGSIVLLHVMFQSRQNSLKAVPLVINGLKAQGYRFVTVSELLLHKNTK